MGKIILSPELLLLFLLVVVVGCGILHVVANKKWGYTEKREKDLEEQPDFVLRTGKNKKKE